MLSHEDKKDVSRAFGRGVASKVHSATDDSLSTAKRHLRADRKSGNITRGGEKTLKDIKSLSKNDSKSKALKKIKEPKWKVESGKKMSKAFGDLIKRKENWETSDTL